MIVRLALVGGLPGRAPRGRPREAKRTHLILHVVSCIIFVVFMYVCVFSLYDWRYTGCNLCMFNLLFSFCIFF